VKAAIMPLHGWLPAAMVAPTPVSALLHAVAVVKAGAFGVLRVVGYVFGVDLLREVGADIVLAVLATATILFGSLRALGETHLKRRLAYSTIGQLSYIVLGAALGSVAALTGAMFHIAAHGFMKITMFFCAGAIHTESHRDDVTQFGGLGRQMPITMTAFAIAAAGLAGTPLLAGFISKWHLGLGALEAGHGVFIVVLVISGLLNLAYFFPIVYDAFFLPAHGKVTPERLSMTAPLAVTAVVALLLGIMPDLGVAFLRLAQSAAMSVVAGSAGGVGP
jgi:multicomponent Na+:H+ antiporter subunit D